MQHIAHNYNSRPAGQTKSELCVTDEREPVSALPSCLKDICCENKGTCCASGILKIINSAAQT